MGQRWGVDVLGGVEGGEGWDMGMGRERGGRGVGRWDMGG